MNTYSITVIKKQIGEVQPIIIIMTESSLLKTFMIQYFIKFFYCYKTMYIFNFICFIISFKLFISGMRFGLMQTKIGLIHILSRYEVLPCKDTPPFPLALDTRSFLLGTTTGIPMTLKRLQTWHLEEKKTISVIDGLVASQRPRSSIHSFKFAWAIISLKQYLGFAVRKRNDIPVYCRDLYEVSRCRPME